MDFLTWDIMIMMAAVGFAAGWVDSIAGGGGLITVPFLLSLGLSPAQTLATNKLQGSFGTFAATANFMRSGHLKFRDIWPMVLLTFIGSATGTLLIQQLDAGFLLDIIPFLLMGVGLYFLLQPQIGVEDRHQKLGLWAFALTCGFSIGFYDGFFGPGTGSFFMVGFVFLMGFNLIKATAHTKILNFTSNIASLIFFMMGGQVLWIVGLVMAMGQMVGGYLGAQMSMKHGVKIIRPLLVIISAGMIIKLVSANPDHILYRWVATLLGN